MKYYLDHPAELEFLRDNYKTWRNEDRTRTMVKHLSREWTHLVTFDAELTTWTRVKRTFEMVALVIFTLGLIIFCSQQFSEMWKTIRTGREKCIVFFDSIHPIPAELYASETHRRV